MRRPSLTKSPRQRTGIIASKFGVPTTPLHEITDKLIVTSPFGRVWVFSMGEARFLSRREGLLLRICQSLVALEYSLLLSLINLLQQSLGGLILEFRLGEQRGAGAEIIFKFQTAPRRNSSGIERESHECSPVWDLIMISGHLRNLHMRRPFKPAAFNHPQIVNA